jgi:hypothetical protein
VLIEIGGTDGSDVTVVRGQLAGGPLLTRFQNKTTGLLRMTQAERQVIQRIGEDVFRDALMDTGAAAVPSPASPSRRCLRASHIIPWSNRNDVQRLDIHNGLLLSALWDAAFDKGLVSFDDDGMLRVSAALSVSARQALGVAIVPKLAGLRDAYRANLAAHRARHEF